MNAFRGLLAVLVLASALSAQTIDVGEYLSLGVFNKWRHQDMGDVSKTSIAEVKKVELKDGVLLYTVAIPVVDGMESLRLVLGVDEGLLGLYSLKLTTDSLDEIDVEKMKFDPPVVFGSTSTELDVDVFTTLVDTGFEIEIDIGPIEEDVDIDVTGAITVRWESVVGDYDAPVGLYGSVDLARLEIDFNLEFQVDEGLLDYSESLTESISMLMAWHAGFMSLIGQGANEFALEKAILPGQALGEFPDMGVNLQTLDFPVGGVLSLNGGADAATTGGDFVLSDIELIHHLDGRLILNGLLAAAGAPPGGEVPVQLKGKLKRNAKTGLSRLSLKGKAKLDSLDKPLSLRAKTDLDGSATSLTLAYKSGPDVLGEMQLGIAPVEGAAVSLTVAGLTDVDLEPKAKRKLGSEGTLTVGGQSFPVTVLEIYKQGDGLEKPDQHRYAVYETGLAKKILRFKATSTEVLDYALAGVKGKLLGTGVKLDPADATHSVADG